MVKKSKLKLIAIITIGLLFVFIGSRKIITMKSINNEILQKTQELDMRKQSNKKMQAELDAAQSNYDYLEKFARESLGLVIQGEKIIVPKK